MNDGRKQDSPTIFEMHIGVFVSQRVVIGVAKSVVTARNAKASEYLVKVARKE